MGFQIVVEMCGFKERSINSFKQRKYVIAYFP